MQCVTHEHCGPAAGLPARLASEARWLQGRPAPVLLEDRSSKRGRTRRVRLPPVGQGKSHGQAPAQRGQGAGRMGASDTLYPREH